MNGCLFSRNTSFRRESSTITFLIYTLRSCQHHAITAHCFLLPSYLYSAIKIQFMITDLFNSRIFYENCQTADNCSENIIASIWYFCLNRTIWIHAIEMSKVLWLAKGFIFGCKFHNNGFCFELITLDYERILKKLVVGQSNRFRIFK